MKKELPREVQAELDRLLDMNPDGLTPAEASFLRARVGYLTNEEQRIFDEVLNPKPAKPEKTSKKESTKKTPAKKTSKKK